MRVGNVGGGLAGLFGNLAGLLQLICLSQGSCYLAERLSPRPRIADAGRNLVGLLELTTPNQRPYHPDECLSPQRLVGDGHGGLMCLLGLAGLHQPPTTQPSARARSCASGTPTVSSWACSAAPQACST
jgi:hypothetical protein